MSKEQLQDIFQKIVDYLRKTDQIGHINLTGGEPLISPYFGELLQWMNRESYIKSYGILSNGTLFTDEQMKALAGYTKLSFVQISLDGSREVHDGIRGQGQFDLAMSALKKLHRKRIQTMVSFTAGKENYKELEAVVELCRQWKVDRFWSDRVVPLGAHGERADIIQKQLMNEEEFAQYISTLYRLSEREKNKLFSHMTVHTNRALQFMANCNELGGYHCAAGKNLMVILANGDLMPCRRLDIVFGNLFQASVEELLEANRDRIEDIHTLPEECEHCRYVEKCKGGAKCMSFAVYGNVKHKDPNCPVERRK